MSNLTTLQFNSFEDFQNGRQSCDSLFFLTQQLQSDVLKKAGDRSEFSLYGFCAVCQRDTGFQVSYRGCDEINGVKIPNWREQLVCPCMLNNRMRAAVHLFLSQTNISEKSQIYLTEQVTPLYNYIKTRYPNTVGSEYLSDDIPFGAVRSDGVRNESLTNLSFEDKQFDCILCFDVLEHIPNYRQALTECYRVLNKFGCMIFTVPFVLTSRGNIIRAKVDDQGNIIHLLEPQYHGDPINIEGGVLCFQDFGWELLDELREIGFNDAKALIYSSRIYGYLGGGQIIFIAQKSKQNVTALFKSLINNFEENKYRDIVISHDELFKNNDELKVPLEGLAEQVGQSEGLFSDFLVGKKLKFQIRSEAPIINIDLKGYLPQCFAEGNSFWFKVGQDTQQISVDANQMFKASLAVSIPAKKLVAIEVISEKILNPKKQGLNSDLRDLSFQLISFNVTTKSFDEST